MIRYSAVFLFLALASCATREMRVRTEAPPAVANVAPVEINPEERDFRSTQELLDAHKPDQAEIAFQSFQESYPQSRYVMLARLGVAQSLEAQEKWSEALVAYQKIHKLTLNEQPEIAVRALYRMSFCYEALGEDDRALAGLLDSYRRRSLLPEEVAKAEIPARLAMFYEKVQNRAEAEKYIAIAQKGISTLQGRPELSSEILAKAYFQMGAVSLNQISASNFSSVVRAMRVVQVYPIRAIALKASPWSEDSLVILKRNYRNLWNTLLDMPGLSGVDEESIQRAKMEQQASLGGELLDLIQQAELYLPLEPEKMNTLQIDLYKYLADLTLKIQDLIYRSEAQMSLTHEAQKLNGLKRPGRIKTDVFFPQEKPGKMPQEKAKEFSKAKGKGRDKKKNSPVIEKDPNL